MARPIAQNRVIVVCKKRLRLRLALGAKHRAGAVKQATAALEQRPQHGEQPCLHSCQLGDVAFASQPAHIGMPAHDSGSRARRIEQDGVERLAIPPCGRLAGVASNHPSLQSEPTQRLMDALATRRIDVQRSHLGIGKFQQVRCLAARCGASIENAQRRP
jgi:hypothetical protein